MAGTGGKRGAAAAPPLGLDEAPAAVLQGVRHHRGSPCAQGK